MLAFFTLSVEGVALKTESSESWSDIQTRQVTNFLDNVRQREAGENA